MKDSDLANAETKSVQARDDGGPAFPVSTVKRREYYDDSGYRRQSEPMAMAEGGMTLLDYFAAKAMQAYVHQGMLLEANTDDEIELQFVNTANFSYRMARAMIKARSA